MADFHSTNINGLGYSYYTKVSEKPDIKLFAKYMAHNATLDLNELVADQMSAIEQMIINSSAFKSQGTKQPYQNKWQAYKISTKTPFSELCLILNRMNVNNLDELIQDSVKYDTLSYNDIKQLADLLLGKCIKEPNNIETYTQFFKKAVNNSLWYVYYEDKVISFLDICLDQLEHDYKNLTKLAGYIEDMYEMQKNKVDNVTVGGVVMTQMHNPESYLKKKNIIIGLIDIIGAFYNNKIISSTLLENIFDNLKERYESVGSTGKKTKIYFELWLALYNKVKNNLSEQSRNYKYGWLTVEKDHIGDDRLVILIENSLNADGANGADDAISIEDFVDNVKNLIANLHTASDYEMFAKEHGQQAERYVSKYLLEQCNKDLTKLPHAISMITKYLMPADKFKKMLADLLDNDELMCDYPNFVKWAKNY
jgi:hypothetical protein